MTDSKDYSSSTIDEIYLLKEQEEEEDSEIQEFTSELILSILEKFLPDRSKSLSLKRAQECLQVLGKIWNLSEYPPTNYIEEIIRNKSKEKLMDMEGYVDEYQYLHIEAINMDLTDIKVIPKHFVWLLSVDLSGNRLNNVTACILSRLPNIVALRLNRNRFKDPYLPPMKHLQYLGLEFNKIESIHRIYHPNLEILNLNFNRIRRIDHGDCWKLSKLMQLELRGNFLKTTSRIEYSTLVNLYLANNRINEIKGMEFLVNLEKLHLRGNPLSDLTGFTKSNCKLAYLNIRSCKISQIDEIKKLKILMGLKELIIKNNIFNPESKNFKRKKKFYGESNYDNDDEDDDNDDDDADDEENEYEDNGDKSKEKSNKQNEEEEEKDSDDQFKEIRIYILSCLPKLKRIDKKIVTKEELQIVKDADTDTEKAI